MTTSPVLRSLRAVSIASVLLLAGCVTAPPAPTRPPADTRSEIVRRMPAKVADRERWAADIETAFAAQRIAPNSENICAVLAVTEQESGYVANPAVANLPKIARGEIDRRAAAMHVPRFLGDAALALRSPDGRTYAERLRVVRTERDLSDIYEDMIGSVPLGKRLFTDYNPVQTGGPMQVGIPFAESKAAGYPYPVDGSIRDEVFTRRGGLYFGIAHLLGYQTPYTRKVHRFADYNAGWYASRNAAFQSAVGVAAGATLALDGDLLTPGAPLDKPGQTERAVRQLAGALRMDERAIRDALERGSRLDFDDTDLYARVYALAEARAGKPLPRAIIPGIRLESPKITRELTTAWFATRVDERYRNCLQR
ncbi:DUF1615 domain-containing protein [Pseudoxanthomonas sp. PXM01]|uniref:DUF1615 domain-containing protein n=1 Tax=Pseudoxanthomonas sp. PXM01 TaxID=2769295 RepID=UPI001784561C|nr:DUF1615 domain-containing protein [Pseudoxanthomonas sp. PXM01]MBD9469589.1 DUF1615 domain-containing protein [Pseudoxanthomonas sp. PXM01]